MNGAEMIAAERKRQIEKEGWTAEHDVQHDDESLVWAAVYYALPDGCGTSEEAAFPASWDRSWAKKAKDTRVRQLVKAGALIAAEIDRICDQQSVQADACAHRWEKIPSHWSICKKCGAIFK